MLNIFKRKNTPVSEHQDTPPPATSKVPEEEKKIGLFKRLANGLRKTRVHFSQGIGTLFLGKKKLDADTLDALEMQLLSADVGLSATQKILNDFTHMLSRAELKDQESLLGKLEDTLTDSLTHINHPLVIPNDRTTPYVILMVGVNGTGKTTTIGKLAKRLQTEGKRVMLAAGDTFRAAAVEQLQAWGNRNDIPVIAQHSGADSASVIFDAIEAAKARNIDVLIADTAGRLHTQTNLMDELKKIKRVIQKLDTEAPHEILLVLDASIGQNALIQTQKFNEALGVSGLTLTKLDGTAKGGIIFAIADKFNIPLRFIGIGEQIDDLREFNAKEFVAALLMQDDSISTR